MNLEAFKGAISAQLGSSPVLEGINSWEAVLYYLASFKDTNPKLVVIIDEFPYLVDQAPALPSTLRANEDETMRSR
ncbi:MAG: hypothetical protein ACOH2N_18795 [Devosia sp.]